MNTLPYPVPSGVAADPRIWLAELRRRQPELAAAALLFALASIPCLIAMFVDARLVNDVSVWLKPTKFLVSLAVFYGTLAWFFGYLPAERQQQLSGRLVIWVPIWVGALEMIWLLSAAIHGVPAHFNRSQAVWHAAYAAAGVGATLLLVVMLLQGFMIARERTVSIAPAFRHGLVLGTVIASATTLTFAGYLSEQDGHWVGGVASDAGGLPLFGWSRTGGDLRVAHFWGLHAHQLVPLAAWFVAASGVRYGRAIVWVLAAGYLGFVTLTFVQALRGVPFLA